MAKRGTALIIIWALLGGCGSQAALCGENEPASILVDASTYASAGNEVEVCMLDPTRAGSAYCSEPGEAWVSVTWYGEYPDVVDYEATRTDADGGTELLVRGSYRLQCQPGTVRVELGVRPGRG